MKESHRSTQIMPVAVLTGMLTGVDLLLKWAMTAWIGFESDRHSWWLAEDWLGFEYARNSGAAFGAFQGNPGILAAISVLVVIGFSTLIYHEVESRLTRIGCMGLLVGGAAGNLIERIRHGYVTDFIAVGPWPRFNLADSAISVAVVVFILAISFQPETRPDEDRLPRDDRGRDREIGHSE